MGDKELIYSWFLLNYIIKLLIFCLQFIWKINIQSNVFLFIQISASLLSSAPVPDILENISY